MAIAETIVDPNWDRTCYGPPLLGDQCLNDKRRTAVSRSCDAFSEIAARGLALLLLALASPLLMALWLAIKLSSKGPGVYCQKRVGQNGRVFVMYKFRSMRCDAEARTGPVWANIGTDPRVTPLGYWLRHLHLDELPQLYNIVRGEMAFVGPRPERPEFVAILAEQIPGYWERLRVKPGITGLAQINLPPDTDLQSVRCKLVLDREYIDSTAPLLDARIATCTFLRLLGLRGGRAAALLGLGRTVQPGDATSRDDGPVTPVASAALQAQAPDASRELASPASAAPLAAVQS